MKNLKLIIEDIKAYNSDDPEQLQAMLWKLLFYSPKMPGRLHQQNLLEAATTVVLKVYDQYFSRSELSFKCFKWGDGPVKVLLTHGWGSKAIDFSELINTLLLNKELQIIAFDAPGNGDAEGELSNLILFVDAIKQVQNIFGTPDIMIGHSLGAMANVLNIHQTQKYPGLLISIAPLVNLTENFKASMNAVNVPEDAQKRFFNSFEALYGMGTDSFLLNSMYSFSEKVKHLLIYEVHDQISPSNFIETFLEQYPSVRSSKYDGSSHAKIIIDQRVIASIDSAIRNPAAL